MSAFAAIVILVGALPILLICGRLRDLRPVESRRGLLDPERRERRHVGYGYDPDARATDARPFPVTVDPGREGDHIQDGIDWSLAGCPMPPTRVEPDLLCAYGHPSLIPVGGVGLAARTLTGRQPRRVCIHGHPAAGTSTPGSGPVQTLWESPAPPAAPSGPVEVTVTVVGGDR
jgi:hypothetical protein